MLTPKLTNCRSCGDIPNLLAGIDCKIATDSAKIYQNIVFMLNTPLQACLIKDLLHYRRILTYKYFNPDYAKEFPVEMISSRVRALTPGTHDCRRAISMMSTTTTTFTTKVVNTTTTTTTL
jgi:hypothetical protein